MSNQASSATRRMSGSRRAASLGTVTGFALALATGLPAAAAPGDSSPVPVPTSGSLSCESFNSPLLMEAGTGRVVTLTDTFTGEEAGRAIIRRYAYVLRGGPQSGQTIQTTYPGPNRNLVECSVLSGPVYYTLALLGPR